MNVLFTPVNNYLPVNDVTVNIVNFGFQNTDPTHLQGPLLKPEHVLQYMVSGKGYYCINNKEYTLNPGDLFYLPKNVLLSYRADAENPYSYFWIGIDGTSAKQLIGRMGLNPDNPVIHCDDKRITELYGYIYVELEKNNFAGYMSALGEFYKLTGLLLSLNEENIQKLKSMSVEYVDKAIIYIKNYYNMDIKITDIANEIGLGRNYFSVIFAKFTGMPPVQYLMRYRIEQACKMLKRGLSVTETAINCGFNSPSNFSVAFKRISGMSPIKYRLSNT